MIEIPAVASARVKHGVLIRMLVNGNDYFIANTYGPITYNGYTYLGLGHFLGMNELQDDLRITTNQIQISLSGIPKSPFPADQDILAPYTSYVQMILGSKIKGSKIWIYRAFFDTTTNALLTSSVSLRFAGYVSNFSLTDGIDLDAKNNEITCVITCASVFGIIERKITGRRTNSTDHRFFYPNDDSMDRVAVISNTSFDFGKPYTGSGTGGGSGSDATISFDGGGA